MSCADCFRGSERADATPTGKVTTLHGLPTYIAEPPQGGRAGAKGIIVIIPDAFGWEFVNNRLLADEYARSGGFTVMMPDFMHGNACPLWVIEPLDAAMRNDPSAGFLRKMSNIARAVYGFGPFMLRNRLSVTLPRVTNFLTELRKNEAARLPVGVAGFCWGGNHLVHLASEPRGGASGKALVDVCFAAHPSGLSFPKDIEGIQKPISIAVGDKDPLMNPAQGKLADAVLTKNRIEHEIVTFEGAGHGFSVRIDRTNPRQTEQAIQAEEQAVNWFTTHFARL